MVGPRRLHGGAGSPPRHLGPALLEAGIDAGDADAADDAAQPADDAAAGLPDTLGDGGSDGGAVQRTGRVPPAGTSDHRQRRSRLQLSGIDYGQHATYLSVVLNLNPGVQGGTGEPTVVISAPTAQTMVVTLTGVILSSSSGTITGSGVVTGVGVTASGNQTALRLALAQSVTVQSAGYVLPTTAGGTPIFYLNLGLPGPHPAGLRAGAGWRNTPRARRSDRREAVTGTLLQDALALRFP